VLQTQVLVYADVARVMTAAKAIAGQRGAIRSSAMQDPVAEDIAATSAIADEAGLPLTAATAADDRGCASDLDDLTGHSV